LYFSRKQRLTQQTEFDAVFGQAKKINHRFLLALYIKNQFKQGRLGIIVGKRVSKSAVTRNRIKRLVRESFRKTQNRLQGLDIIVLIRQHCPVDDNTQLKEAIDQLWEKFASYP